MINELQFLEKSFKTKLQNITKDAECEAYFGYSFNVESYRIKYRKAKITPTKTGQFVTFWKRDNEGKTVPLDEKDSFDFYVIQVETETNLGFFVFPKKVLIQQQIVSSVKEGKRGFRVYPIWDFTENKQAQKSQKWQNNYFIDLSENKADFKERFFNILEQNQ